MHRPQQAPEHFQMPQEDDEGRDAQTPSPEKWILATGLRRRPDVELQVGTALELRPSSPPTLPHPLSQPCSLPSHFANLEDRNHTQFWRKVARGDIL